MVGAQISGIVTSTIKGLSPSGKARDFDSLIRRFESDPLWCKKEVSDSIRDFFFLEEK